MGGSTFLDPPGDQGTDSATILARHSGTRNLKRAMSKLFAGGLIKGLLPVGLYHTPFFGYLILGLGSQNHRVGYPKKGVWYEPTGRYSASYKEFGQWFQRAAQEPVGT